MKTENFIIDVNVDIRKRSSQTLGITLMSQDINNYTFALKIKQDGELLALDDTYEVEVLSLFTTSKTSRLVKGAIKTHQVEWMFDTSYISQSEVVKNYVYVRKDGELLVSADVNCFIFNVGLSEIDKGAGKVAEVYDENYEKVLADYSGALDERTTERLDEAVLDFNQRGDAEIADWREGADSELEDYLAGRVVLENLITNGNFSNGLDSWETTGVITSGSTVSDGKLHVYGENSGSTNAWPVVRQDSKTVGGNTYYFYFEISDMPENSTTLSLQDRNTVIMTGVRNGTHSKIETVKDGQALTKIYLNHTIQANGFVDYKVVNLMVIDLSETFGAGNEPSKEWMDRLIEQTGYFDEHVLDEDWKVGEMVRLGNTKANKVQEDWITPTLLNGATTPSGYEFRYRKNEIGIVEFIGRLVLPSSGVIAFYMPVGYRPITDRASIFGAVMNVYTNNARLDFFNTGGVYTAFYGTNITVDFTGMSYPTGG